jgi:uncharacterized protein DUF4159/aerotolerance regulator-like protein
VALSGIGGADMMAGVSFLSPMLLWALLLLPILWWLLRAVPPAPIRAKFPGILLLLGLKDKETTPDRTPWWLLMLRIFAIAAAVIGFAGPVVNPEQAISAQKKLVILMDASWASANDWSGRQSKLTEILRDANQTGRPTVLVRLTDPPQDAVPPNFVNAKGPLQRVSGVSPNPWRPDFIRWAAYWAAQDAQFDTVWFSDGLDAVGRQDLYDTLAAKGNVAIFEGANPVIALSPPQVKDGKMAVTALRSWANGGQDISANAVGPDPNGVNLTLSTASARFSPLDMQTELLFDMPSDLRNRIRSVAVEGQRSAGGVVVTGDTVQRRKVALIAPADQQESTNLVSDVFYLRKALAPTAEVIETDLKNTLLANPDVIVFVDIGKLSETETKAVTQWVDKGGLLVRFAGPRLAASQIGLRAEHPLLPVRLRAGGRSVGGAMSWGAPKKLRAFEEGSAFYGLKVPDEVTVSSQVVAQPDPDLAERVVAALQDGTPLVTQKYVGNGRVVLFHVTANAEWSNLPLSGLFVQMLERLAVSTSGALEDIQDLEGLIWKPEQAIDAFGVIRDISGLPGVEGAALAARVLSADLPPGVYSNGGRKAALNVMAKDMVLEKTNWPSAATVLPLVKTAQRYLKPYFLIAALGLMLLDIFAALWLSGKLTKRFAGQIASVVLALAFAQPNTVRAQSEEQLLNVINNTVLAYVKTGNTKIDKTSQAGLLGLSTELFRRTSVEPIEPVGVDIEQDELSIFPFLYWPMTEGQPIPSDAAVEKLNRFLRSGGMILFDTRDAQLSNGVSGGTPNGRMLQKIAARLEIPPLEPVPEDHVLTRSFYLLQDFPGRSMGTNVWIEAAPADATKIEGMPFRNLNDGVSPVIIGGNDWAAAWAIDQNGRYMFPVGRGFSGDQQREYAQRFGVNLIMYVLTGNYKSDQVHIPALLNRLGQ